MLLLRNCAACRGERGTTDQRTSAAGGLQVFVEAELEVDSY